MGHLPGQSDEVGERHAVIADECERVAAIRHERRDAAENRQRVLDVARQLFGELGVENVSMHQIAQAAGVGQGTLYRRYCHKGELCMDLLQESGQYFLQSIQDCQYGSGAAKTPLERLDDVLERLVHFIEEKAAFLGAISEATSGDRRKEKYSSALYNHLHATIAAMLDEAVEAGELSPLDSVYTADAILASLNPDLYRFQRQERGLSREQILAAIRRIYVRGLVSSPQSAPHDPATL